MARKRRPLTITWNRHAWLGLAVIVLIGALVTAASWPIYGKMSLALAGGAGTVAGILLGILLVRRNISLVPAIVLAIAGYLVVALAAAVPWMYSSLPFSLPRAFLTVLTGSVLSWKSLLTIAIPVGDFQDTQIPLFLTVYIASLLATYFLLHPRRKWSYALIPLGISLLFPTVFGSGAAAESLNLGPITIPAHLHQLGGLAGFAVLLGWPVLRGRRERAERVAAARIQAEDEARPVPSGREMRARLRQRFIAAGMVITAVLAALFVTVPLADWRSRFVPRSGMENTIDMPELASPLAAYRANFTSDTLDATLLTLDGETPSRLRFATLSAYDGVAFRAADPEQPSGVLTQFERVPYKVAGTTGRLREASVTVGAYSGQWLPLASEFSQADFTGADRLELASGFYFNRSTQTGIEKIERSGSTGLRQGDTYRLIYADSGILDESASEASELVPSASAGVIRPDEDAMPNLYQWLAQQNASAPSVAEVMRLRDALMERSYLGRSKAEPEGENTWMPEGYVFRSSDSGETMDRLDTMFANMLDVRYQSCSQPTDKCAAHVGDEEQYAAATALIARALGFPSRIVYGANVPVSGAVTGKDVTVWPEIQASDGTWVALHITPREDNAFVEQPDEESFRQYNPATDSENAKVVDPPAKDPSTTGEQNDEEIEVNEPNPYLPYILRGLAILGIALLLTSPIWGILLAKALRRRRRKRREDTSQRVLGAWDEYVDRLVDSGEKVDASATRSEFTAARSPEAQSLAVGADYAAFSGRELSAEQADNYWARASEERSAVTQELSLRRRIKTYLSPKSFGHYRKNSRNAEESSSFLRTGLRKVKQ